MARAVLFEPVQRENHAVMGRFLLSGLGVALVDKADVKLNQFAIYHKRNRRNSMMDITIDLEVQ